MASSIIDSMMSLLGPQLTGPLASRLGQSEGAVQQGLQGGSAAILGAIANRSSQPGFLNQIGSLISSPENTAGILSNPAALLSGSSPLAGLGSKFLSLVFGSQQSGVADAVGRTTGLSSGTASSLLGMAAPLVLGVLGSRFRDGSLNVGNLGSTLKNESSTFQRFLPTGFSSLLGGASNLASGEGARAVAAVKENAVGRWLWPLIVALIIIALILWWIFSHRKPMTEAVNQATTSISNTAQSAWASLGALGKRTLPNGVELNIPAMGVENKLIDFIQDTSKPVDETTWFDFDRLLFDTGKATLQPASQEQLQNIAEILKAYPKVTAKIGGYTDNTGSEAANLALSAARAKNVMDALVSSGVDPSRLTSEGYGDQHPVADNSTAEGRQKNRRISLRVTAK